MANRQKREEENEKRERRKQNLKAKRHTASENLSDINANYTEEKHEAKTFIAINKRKENLMEYINRKSKRN